LLRYVDAAAVPEAKVRTEHARTFATYLVGTYLSLHSLPLGWKMQGNIPLALLDLLVLDLVSSNMTGKPLKWQFIVDLPIRNGDFP